MVSVGMSNQNGIQMLHSVTQHLLPEIRPDVEKDMPTVVGTKQCRGA